MSSSSKSFAFFSYLIQTYLLCSELVNGCLVAERRALLQFRSSLVDPENRLSSWRGRECCSWRGIRCDNQTGSVTFLNLRNPYPKFYYPDTYPIDFYPPNPEYYHHPDYYHRLWNLSGKIDDSLLQLKSLEHLDLSCNTFEAIPIPQFFGSLEKLGYLNLSYAGFSGTVPAQLGNLSRLQYLDLSSALTPLVVDDFHWVSCLSSLKVMSLNFIDLSKVEHGLFQALNKLSSLRELRMKWCNVAGIVQNLPFINLTSLQVINLSVNRFNTMIPSWFANLSSLVHLDLSDAAFYGPIPEIWRISSLKYVDISSNDNLTADISKLLGGNWRQIKSIRLAENGVHGFLPDSVGNLTSLVELDLFHNNIEGGIPSSMGKICNLKLLGLARNNLTQALPKSLEVQGCLSDKPLPNLYLFGMDSNRIGGILPEWLGNKLSGEFPETLIELSGLLILDLSKNNLTGKIPQNIDGMKELESLDLSKNHFFGEIPNTMSSLTFLRNLNVSNNNFSGVIPEGGQMTTFSPSAFSGNKFLCGLPLIVACKENNPNMNHTYHDNGDDNNEELVDDWFFLVLVWDLQWGY